MIRALNFTDLKISAQIRIVYKNTGETDRLRVQGVVVMLMAHIFMVYSGGKMFY